MKLSFVILCRTAVFSLCLNGCSIHPSIERSEGYRTIEVVDRIRCEAKLGIENEAIRLLREPTADKYDLALADALEHDRNLFVGDNLRPLLRTFSQKYFYIRYIDSAIAYNFAFDISEEDLNSTNVDILKAVTNGSVSLNLTASSERKRQNRRAFLISETFGHLLDDTIACLPPKYDPLRRANNNGREDFLFPVTGSIGLQDLVETFIAINREAILKTNKDDTAPTVADKLIFTTTFIGSVNPQVMLNPVGQDIGLKTAMLSNKATRSDINQVIVGLSLSPKSVEKAERFKYSSRKRLAGLSLPIPFAAARTDLVDSAFARKVITYAEQRAINAISQLRLESFYDSFDRILSR